MFPGLGFSLESCALEDPHTVNRILFSSIAMITARIKTTQETIVNNMAWVQELQRRAYEDPGTGLLRQSFLENEIANILEEPTALIMVKPDRFKVLVDSRGHKAGDKAMIEIAKILRDRARRLGEAWSLRFKSNETGILLKKCSPARAKEIARDIQEAVAALEPVPALENYPLFFFTAGISYAVWPYDNSGWDDLLEGTQTLLLDTWQAGGNRISHYQKGKV
jgi:diguanylate cyclase (GGDEF)-like protein